MQTLYNNIHLLGDGPDLGNVERLDLGAIPMVNRMMQTGLQIDPTHFENIAKVLTQDMDRLTEQVYDMTGYHINLDSGDQKSDLLFKKLGIKQEKPKMTKSGDRESVEGEVLTAIQHEHPVVSVMQEYAECSKLRGTYALPIPKLARGDAQGRRLLYPNFGCTRIPSSRLNCKDPNLLAMPNKTDRARQMCEGFIADEGWSFVSIDFSQIEPRVAAHRSKDPNLTKVYQNQEDIYSDFAIAAFKLKDERFRDAEGWHYPGVDKKKHRFPAKTCSLASLYDVTAPGLLEQLPIVCGNCNLEASKHTCSKFISLWTENKAQDLINAFYIKYPSLMAMRKIDHGRARKHGYVWDDFGRILHVAAVRSVLDWVVSAALREAANFTIQSFAQGLLKVCMAQIENEFIEMGIYNELVKIVLQIHDELLFLMRNDMIEEIAGHVVNVFENCCVLDVPIKASVATAPNWGSLPK